MARFELDILNLYGEIFHFRRLFAALWTMASASAQTPEQAPSPSLVSDSTVYELRTYHAYPGKLEDLHKRFREHTLTIFEKHGMKVVGFWGPTDKDKGSENSLIYILEFPSREAATKAWKELAPILNGSAYQRPQKPTASWSRRWIRSL